MHLSSIIIVGCGILALCAISILDIPLLVVAFIGLVLGLILKLGEFV